ncbi:DUF3307 domain-containing protein [Lacihabitans soyangensis]|uniref:DUF3307 domain-containing protein n=1 Tax=Lacihabitans soyangensis TaxID=869394 RepID=UPI0020CF3087|nr:DUF3307 domain-containing protein [Lacihabitans soyangensis]
MIAWVLKLTLAHLLGDFMLQPDKWIEHKNRKTYRSKYLYFHVLIHFVLLLLVLAFDFKYWAALILIPISHYVIDLGKLLLRKKIETRILFFIDQALHFFVIFLITKLYFSFQVDFSQAFKAKVLLLLIAFISISYVASVVIKILISKWKQENETTNAAGKYIGMMERILVFVFIVLNHWEGVGFLLAAKSVFRFGDLTKSHEVRLTEYILIGTLLSFGIAIGIALGYQKLLKLI